MKIANTDREGLLNDLKNFNEIFRKDVTYDNITKNQGFTLSLEDTFLEKQGRSN